MGWLDAIASTGLKELASSPQAAQLLAQYLGQPSIGGLPKLTELFDEDMAAAWARAAGERATAIM